jgi:hypothetical protein
MSKNFIIVLVVVGCVVLGGSVFAGIYFSTVNREAQLVNQGEAQQKVCMTTFDKVWKTIEQKVQILDAYRDDFKSIIFGEMSQRYQGEVKGAPMFKWLTEHNINVSTELYKEIMDCVEANRAEFNTAQKRLVDIKLQHDNMLVTAPWNMFLAGKKPLEIKLVTSSKTEKTFESGKEDDIQLIKKN